MTTHQLFHRPPAPLDLLVQLLDERAVQAEATLLRARRAGDAADLWQAEAHRAVLDQLTVEVLGGMPSGTSKAFDSFTVPVWTPDLHWHLAVTDGTLRWLDNVTVHSARPDALVSGLLASISADQRHLALRLFHPDEVADLIGVTTDAVHDYIEEGQLGYCLIVDTIWVVQP